MLLEAALLRSRYAQNDSFAVRVRKPPPVVETLRHYKWGVNALFETLGTIKILPKHHQNTNVTQNRTSVIAGWAPGRVGFVFHTRVMARWFVGRFYIF